MNELIYIVLNNNNLITQNCGGLGVIFSFKVCNTALIVPSFLRNIYSHPFLLVGFNIKCTIKLEDDSFRTILVVTYVCLNVKSLNNSMYFL